MNAASQKRQAAAPAKLPSIVHLQMPSPGEATLKQLGGSNSDFVNNAIANATQRSIWFGNQSPDECLALAQAALITVAGIDPKDEIEGMIAAQLVASHNAAMECFRRAMISEQSFEGRAQNLNFANKLVRSYTALVEALDRHRGKGQQKVTVEHVHVHKGGQAIVGNITPGGGSTQKTKEQSHVPKGLEAPDGTSLPSPFETVEAAVPEPRR